MIRTKRHPMVGTDAEGYAARYFDDHRHLARIAPVMLDPAPRVVVDPRLGVLTAGETAAAAAIAGDVTPTGHLRRRQRHL